MSDWYQSIRPLLFLLPPELAHTLTLKVMRAGVMPRYVPIDDPALQTHLWGHKFPNPVGLSAGFDKNAEALRGAFHMGFGFVEAGTVTPKPQHGNPKPRVFRNATHEAVINRMGFPNGGMNAFKKNFEKFLSGKKRPAGVVGINIGMNKTQKDPVRDYTILINVLGPMADYLTINISSPNTPGLRDLQKRETLLPLIRALQVERRKACGEHGPAILVKFAPDLDEAQIEELAETALDAEIDGLILTNTTLARPEFLPQSFRDETGGLSGRPLTDKSTAIIKTFYKRTNGKIPIIGVGGITDGHDAYEKIKAGANLVQIYSALVFHGPAMVHSINQELLKLLKSDGFDRIGDAVGCTA